jgi:hypothetical protein
MVSRESIDMRDSQCHVVNFDKITSTNNEEKRPETEASKSHARDSDLAQDDNFSPFILVQPKKEVPIKGEIRVF